MKRTATALPPAEFLSLISLHHCYRFNGTLVYGRAAPYVLFMCRLQTSMWLAGAYPVLPPGGKEHYATPLYVKRITLFVYRMEHTVRRKKMILVTVAECFKLRLPFGFKFSKAVLSFSSQFLFVPH
jgi:hypothetical protein